MNKYNWKNAPIQAKFAVTDKGGKSWWSDLDDPTPEIDGTWSGGGVSLCEIKWKEMDPEDVLIKAEHWTKSLEYRPD